MKIAFLMPSFEREVRAAGVPKRPACRWTALIFYLYVVNESRVQHARLKKLIFSAMFICISQVEVCSGIPKGTPFGRLGRV